MISVNLIYRIKTLPIGDQKIEFTTLKELANKKILEAENTNLPFLRGQIKPLERYIEFLDNLIDEL